MEELMKEWLERYRPVRQLTFRSARITKDKAGALPLDVYAVQPTGNESEERLSFLEEIDIILSRCSRITKRYKLMNMRRF